jgi:hypothetical protein
MPDKPIRRASKVVEAGLHFGRDLVATLGGPTIQPVDVLACCEQSQHGVKARLFAQVDVYFGTFNCVGAHSDSHLPSKTRRVGGQGAGAALEGAHGVSASPIGLYRPTTFTPYPTRVRLLTA